jgi:hypothetical protein
MFPRISILLAFFWSLASPGYWAAHGADVGLNLVLRPDLREVSVWHRGNPILVYAFATNQFKPYVRELYTLDGINVLRDAPADHPHHHGLMYAIQVNGINFWEETKTAGHQIPRADLTRNVKRDTQGVPHARFTHVIDWVPPDAAQLSDPTPSALLIESRSIAISVDAASSEIAVEWLSEFDLGPAAQHVTLTGMPYHGLGLRLPVEFDQAAQRLNPAGLPFSDAGRDEVTEAHWIAASQTVSGRAYTVALFHHPSNAGRHRAFSMINPFAYLSATQGLDEAPLEYRRGDRFTLRHLVIVRPERPTEESLERRYQLWIQ